jgi:hypothetical protein
MKMLEICRLLEVLVVQASDLNPNLKSTLDLGPNLSPGLAPNLGLRLNQQFLGYVLAVYRLQVAL